MVAPTFFLVIKRFVVGAAISRPLNLFLNAGLPTVKNRRSPACFLVSAEIGKLVERYIKLIVISVVDFFL